ncbi:AraC family transcriptional regulator [Streptomyces gibsoniae]|uniref:AraC family transcriptional regulator n=1 Tax=Streptomyces gibsoniae TaxID=3075529 RepID=A0ABU2U7X4_9ACTN|nr:AraC family transcriptional regulator [Streptomyces sp. DSM 41699]MDT0469273.1 AraC family transcriptional regulator [Streptomyces sp. DSM 41699]
MSSVRESAAYWRVPGLALEAMQARFHDFAYPMHAHDTYSFGVTDRGAQSFLCRGRRCISGAGRIMAFNPDEPHDGHSAADQGYRYRMLHLDKELVHQVLADAAPSRAGLPLFAEPVVDDPPLAHALARLHRAVVADAPRLVVDERLTTAVLGVTARAASRPARLAGDRRRMPGTIAAARARALLRERFAEDLSIGELAQAAGCSRYALYRSFRIAYGFAPSEYQRDLRLRRARALLAGGTIPSLAAAETGFADQAHLTRWFTRTYGITPSAYRTAAHSGQAHVRPTDQSN